MLTAPRASSAGSSGPLGASRLAVAIARSQSIGSVISGAPSGASGAGGRQTTPTSGAPCGTPCRVQSPAENGTSATSPRETSIEPAELDSTPLPASTSTIANPASTTTGPVRGVEPMGAEVGVGGGRHRRGQPGPLDALLAAARGRRGPTRRLPTGRPPAARCRSRGRGARPSSRRRRSPATPAGSTGPSAPAAPATNTPAATVCGSPAGTSIASPGRTTLVCRAPSRAALSRFATHDETCSRRHRLLEADADLATLRGVEHVPGLGLAVGEPEMGPRERPVRVQVDGQALVEVEQLDEHLGVGPEPGQVIGTEPRLRIVLDGLDEQPSVGEPAEALRRLPEARGRRADPLLRAAAGRRGRGAGPRCGRHHGRSGRTGSPAAASGIIAGIPSSDVHHAS